MSNCKHITSCVHSGLRYDLFFLIYINSLLTIFNTLITSICFIDISFNQIYSRMYKVTILANDNIHY